MIDDIRTYLRMFAPSQRHLTHAAAIADDLSAATNLDASSIAGIALAESAAASAGDIGILNFALTLEHFETALYRTLIKSGLLTGKALTFAQSFGAQESAHVAALTKTISQLGGTPVREQAAYNFPKLKTEAEVIATLAKVEDVGASAYLGAAGGIGAIAAGLALSRSRQAEATEQE